MTRAESRAIVAVEVLVEEHEVAPVRIVPEFCRATVHGPAADIIAQEDPDEAFGYLLRDLEQVHQPA